MEDGVKNLDCKRTRYNYEGMSQGDVDMPQHGKHELRHFLTCLCKAIISRVQDSEESLALSQRSKVLASSSVASLWREEEKCAHARLLYTQSPGRLLSFPRRRASFLALAGRPDTVHSPLLVTSFPLLVVRDVGSPPGAVYAQTIVSSTIHANDTQP